MDEHDPMYPAADLERIEREGKDAAARLALVVVLAVVVGLVAWGMK